MVQERGGVHGGDWVQLVVESPSKNSLVLKPPSHRDAVGLAPLEESEFAAVSLVPAAAKGREPSSQLLAPGDVVSVHLAGGFLRWAVAAEEPGAAPAQEPRALVWIDEDDITKAERESMLLPCRFRLLCPDGADAGGGSFGVGASVVLAPVTGEEDGSGGSAAAALVTVQSEEPDAPLRLAVASVSASACSSTPVVFTMESIVYSAFEGGGGEKGEGAEEGELGPPPAAAAAATPAVTATSASPAPSAEGNVEGEEHEVVFEEGDLGITIKRTPHGQARVLRALPGTQAERNGIRAGDVLRAVGGVDLRPVVLDSRRWTELVALMKTRPRPLAVTVFRGKGSATAGGAEADQDRASELHALERRLDFSTLGSRPPGLLPLEQPRRSLLYRGRVALLQEGRLFGHSLVTREAFLLSDALLLVVPPPPSDSTAAAAAAAYHRPSRATVEAAIGLATCKIKGQASTAAASLPWDAEFGFELVTPSGGLVLYAPSAEARAHWVERIYRGIVGVLSDFPHPDTRALIRHQLVIDTLHSAVIRGHMDEARGLLASGGDSSSSSARRELASQRDAAGRTPLHYACLMRRHDMVSFLLSSQAAADPALPDKRGRLPLHLAALALDDVAIALLLSIPAAQSLANARDEDGHTPAFLAAVHGRLPSNGGGGGESSSSEGDEHFALRRCLNALLAHDADIDARDQAGRTPLHAVSPALRPEAVRALLDLGADANAYSDADQATPLMLACRDAASDLGGKRATTAGPTTTTTPAPVSSALDGTLQALLQRGGAQPNLRAGPQGRGRTALHLLLENGTLDWADKTKALGLLVSHGARLDVPSSSSPELPPVTGAQALATLLKGEGDGGRELKAALEATIGAAKTAWGLKKAGGPKSSSSSEENGGSSSKAAAAKLSAADLSRLVSKAAARPTIRPMAAAAASSSSPSSSAGGGASCLLCGEAFNALTKRPQHCRLCGHQICTACSGKKLPLGSAGGGGGSSGEAARVCDGCFNWGSQQMATMAAAAAASATRAGEDGAEAVAAARQRREETRAQQEASEQKELFGAAAALGERAMSWLVGEGGGQDEAKARRQRQAATARVTGQMEELRVGLQQRGERIENLADSTNELVESSAQFAAMARQLNERSKGWGGLW